MSYWICDKDQNCIDCPKHYPEETCEHWIEVEPVKDIHTNADRIRAMTDEELAEWTATLPCCPPGPDLEALCYPKNGCKNMHQMRKCWLNWLKQEVEDG